MERTLRISIGSKWNDRYTRHLGIVDHIHELAAIDDEIRREKNRGTPGEAPDAAVRNLEAHFQQELADLMLIALNELGDDEIEARRRKFLEKDASPAMPSSIHQSHHATGNHLYSTGPNDHNPPSRYAFDRKGNC